MENERRTKEDLRIVNNALDIAAITLSCGELTKSVISVSITEMWPDNERTDGVFITCVHVTDIMPLANITERNELIEYYYFYVDGLKYVKRYFLYKGVFYFDIRDVE